MAIETMVVTSGGSGVGGTITIEFPLKDNYSNTTSSYNGNGTLKEGIFIQAPADYGFPNATTISAVAAYYTSVTAGVGNCRVIEDSNGDGVYSQMGSSEITVTETVLTRKLSPSFTIPAYSKLYLETKINSVLNTIKIYGGVLILTFS